jgi:hypothetical protein
MIRTRRTPRPRPTLEDILDGPDPLGLLAVAAPRSRPPTSDERLIANFRQIEAFVEREGREPSAEANAFQEAALGTRLKAIRSNPDHAAGLAEYDRLGLLQTVLAEMGQHSEQAPGDTSRVPTESPPAPAVPSVSSADGERRAAEEVTSLDEIFASDPLGLLDQGDESLFTLTHVPAVTERDTPDEIAQRTTCEDFYLFEQLFERLRRELRAREIEVVKFTRETQIREGDAFILGGMMCLVDKVGEKSEDAERFNPRLRVIFDNGTESNLLLRSLATALYKDDHGRRILQHNVEDQMRGITHRDKRSGVVYILRSLSQDPALRSVRHLHKIGYTEKSVAERIVGAERQQTYLEAPVKVVATFDCYNLNPRRFESLVHAMLHHQRINMTLKSRDGGTYHPREWFDVPLETAREVVMRIVDGTITHYRMNNTTGRLVAKTI